MPTYTLTTLAEHVGAELVGDGQCQITGIAPLHQAQAGQVSFLDNPKYRKYLQSSQASAVIIAPDLANQCQSNALVVQNPYFAYAKIAELFLSKPVAKPGVAPSAVIADSANIAGSASIAANVTIGERVVIGEHAVIGPGCVIDDGVTIGHGSQLMANVTVYYDVSIGRDCLIHSGAVIGADGFGLAKNEGVWHKIPQLGAVVIGNHVEIGANTTIDRGALDNTQIGDGVKLDNLVQIGHNAVIGEHSVVAGCVGISGSTRIGKHCIIGGGACIVGHIEIADNVTVTGMGAVSSSIKESGIYSSGTNVRPNREWRKNSARFHQLDNMARRLKALEKLVEQQLAETENE